MSKYNNLIKIIYSFWENRRDNACFISHLKDNGLLEPEDEDMQEAFNAAINFALDDADGEGIIFLRMWREGDWQGILKEFPEFKSPILHPKA